MARTKPGMCWHKSLQTAPLGWAFVWGEDTYNFLESWDDRASYYPIRILLKWRWGHFSRNGTAEINWGCFE